MTSTDWTRRRMLGQLLGTLGACACPTINLLAAPPHPDVEVALLLNQLSPLVAGRFDPVAALAAIQALHAQGRDAAIASLRRFAAKHRARKTEPPGALFAVARALFQIPPRSAPMPQPDTPRTVIRPGYLRPPALGAPIPSAPSDPSLMPYFPLILIGDLPLVVVAEYMLAGESEPFESHLDSLAREGVWRTKPLRPKSADDVRYQLIHWGGLSNEQAQLVEPQLERYEKG